MNVIRQDVVQIGFEVNDKGLNNVNKSIDKLKSSVTKVKPEAITKPLSDLGNSAKNVSKATQKFQSLNKAIQDGDNKIKKLKSSIKNLPNNAINKISNSVNKVKTKFSDLKEKVEATKKALTGGEKGVKGFVNSLKNIGKISVSKITSGLGKIKDYLSRGSPLADKLKNGIKKVDSTSVKNLNNGLKSVGNNLTKIAKKASGAAFRGLKKLAGITFKGLVAGLGAAATAVTGLVAKSVSAYADYEQLVGGVETLLGAKGAKNVQEYAKITGKSVDSVKGEYSKLMKSQNTVIKNANNAYKTAGLSANEYMETVTGFSASLLQSVGGDTQKAAKLADVAISDMADNANKMGLKKTSSCKTNRIAGKPLEPDELQRDLKKCA